MTTSAREQLLSLVKEADFRAQVIRWAERLDWLVYFTWNSRHSPAGFPDLVMVRPPRLLLVELKTQLAPPPKGRQLMWLDTLGLVPCVEVYLWRPLDERDILTVLA